MRLKKDEYRELMSKKGITAEMIVADSELTQREVEWALKGNQLSNSAVELLAYFVDADVQDVVYVDKNMKDENVIEFFTNDDTATVTFHQPRYKTRIRKLAEQKPDDVQILSDDGTFMVAKVPVKWVRVSPPAVMDLSDEQRAVLAERMKALRSSRTEENPFVD